MFRNKSFPHMQFIFHNISTNDIIQFMRSFEKEFITDKARSSSVLFSLDKIYSYMLYSNFLHLSCQKLIYKKKETQFEITK